MIAQRDRPAIGPDEYLAAEATSPVKHEYRDGEVYAMAGASDEHVTIAANLTALLLPVARQRGCRLYGADMKVRIDPPNCFYYPDLLVSCDPRDRETRYYKKHPKLIVEILSDGTEAFDRGDKFRHYRQLDSLEEYLLVSQNCRAIDAFRRTGDRAWAFESYPPGEALRLVSLDCAIAIAEIYADLDLPSASPARPPAPDNFE